MPMFKSNNLFYGEIKGAYTSLTYGGSPLMSGYISKNQLCETQEYLGRWSAVNRGRVIGFTRKILRVQGHTGLEPIKC